MTPIKNPPATWWNNLPATDRLPVIRAIGRSINEDLLTPVGHKLLTADWMDVSTIDAKAIRNWKEAS